MSEEQVQTPAPRICQGCEKELPKGRGVCPHCGQMTTWFKVRFFLGGAFVLLGFLCMVAMMILALIGGGGQ